MKKQIGLRPSHYFGQLIDILRVYATGLRQSVRLRHGWDTVRRGLPPLPGHSRHGCSTPCFQPKL